jgi:hypothetical protein
MHQSKAPTILLDGRITTVTENLHSALLHLRLPSESRLIWIDALCINQKDDKERNHQVKEMKQIYRGAARVLAWLGPEADDSDLAMDIVAKAGDLINPGWAFFSFASDRQSLALIALLQRAYWSRVWIIQGE